VTDEKTHRVRAFRHADLRVVLLLMLLNGVVVMFCVHEASFIALLALAFLWLCLRGQLVRGLQFVLAYALLSGLSYLTLGVRGFETLWMLANLSRHMLIPVAYTFSLVDAATGTLLTVFHRLRLPKAFGISTVVLLRFIPTIGYEFGAIRSSLKFRGTGIGFWSTVAHLPANFERTVVPLLIRTTRIADELSAAAVVRGVRLNNEINSFEEVGFKASDLAISLLFGILVITTCLVDRVVLPWVTA
jgi:energy-coupling factor transport system permease protein